MNVRNAPYMLLAGAILAATVTARAANTVPVTPLWLQVQNNAVLQSQINQQAAQQRMQQMLNDQQLRQGIQRQNLQTDQEFTRLQLRTQLDQQNATISQSLQQQQLLLLNLQQSTKPLPKSVLDQLASPPPKKP